MDTFDNKNLKKWFLSEQRDLPWRENPTPYRVWVSEIMLQQTRVAVVIPYFTRWMQLFPSIQKLAAAPLDEVIKAWEGLGYYSRARNLHAGAKQVMEEFDGCLPLEEVSLGRIKGLGPYTIGAIRSFAFRQKAPAVDGNVLRVLSRYYAIDESIDLPKTQKKIREKILQFLPDEEPWIISEALIELGATVCGKKPKCTSCPINRTCQAHLQGTTQDFPRKKARIPVTNLHRAVAVLLSKDNCLVRRGTEKEIMTDLHEFLYYETGSEGWATHELAQRLYLDWGIHVQPFTQLEPIKHSFTRYRVNLTTTIFYCQEMPSIPGYQWQSFASLDKLAFSSGHKRIYQIISKLV